MPSLHEQTTTSVSTTQTKEAFMRQNKFPPGWNAARVDRVLAHYETQTEEEAVAEDEAAREASDGTLMEVPKALVPTIREIIAKYKKSA